MAEIRINKIYWDTLKAAEFLDKSPATLERWRWAGTGPKFYKIGSHVRYTPDSLIEFAETNMYTSTAQYTARNPKAEAKSHQKARYINNLKKKRKTLKRPESQSGGEEDTGGEGE